MRRKHSKSRAIYLKCLECSGNNRTEVVLCTLKECPLWEYRCGYHISHKKYKEKIEKTFSDSKKVEFLEQNKEFFLTSS